MNKPTKILSNLFFDNAVKKPYDGLANLGAFLRKLFLKTREGLLAGLKRKTRPKIVVRHKTTALPQNANKCNVLKSPPYKRRGFVL